MIGEYLPCTVSVLTSLTGKVLKNDGRKTTVPFGSRLNFRGELINLQGVVVFFWWGDKYRKTLSPKY